MTFTTSGNLLGAAPVAQLVEQRTFNPRVLRSIRSGGTDFPLWRLPSNMQAKIQLELCPQPELPGFCWGWTGALNSKGYGSVAHQGRVWSSHRLSFTLLIGEVPSELQIDHLCLNKRCCNPAHLEAVTALVNVRRARQDHFYCAQGHPLAGRNLKIRVRNGNERRACHVCQLEWQRQNYQKRHPGARPRSFASKRAEILVDAQRALADIFAVEALMTSEAAS